MKIRPVTADVDNDRQDEIGRGVKTESGQPTGFISDKSTSGWILDGVGDPALAHGRRVDECVVDGDVIDDHRVTERCLVEILAGWRLSVRKFGPVETDGSDPAAGWRDLRHLADDAGEIRSRGDGREADIDRRQRLG